MKQALAHLKTISAIALLILVAGCAGNLHEKENLAVAAGFKTITPTNANQAALLTALPADKVTPITHQGKTLLCAARRQKQPSLCRWTQAVPNLPTAPPGQTDQQ